MTLNLSSIFHKEKLRDVESIRTYFYVVVSFSERSEQSGLRTKGLNGPPPPLSFLLIIAHPLGSFSPQPSTTVKLKDASYDFQQGNTRHSLAKYYVCPAD